MPLGCHPCLNLRRGNATAVVEQDRDAAIAELLSLHPAVGAGGHPMLRGRSSGRRYYTEARLGSEIAADDQLPSLVSAVKGILAFEQDVLSEVTRTRAAYSPTGPILDQAAVSDETSAAVRSLFAVVEDYPDLESRQNVLDLQHEIERLESMIADRRELYNDQVYRFNTRISTLPTLLLAWAFGWMPRPFFAAQIQQTARPSIDLASDR